MVCVFELRKFFYDDHVPDMRVYMRVFVKLSISGNSCCQFVKAIKTVDNWKSVD